MRIQELIGRGLGYAVAPISFFASLLRGDRMFHPDGVIYRADVSAIASHAALGLLAERLAGTAIVRLSGGLWQWSPDQRRPDALGVSIRFRDVDSITPDLLPGDQDILFVSARTLPELLVAPLRTDVDDFLNNQYHAVLPFRVEGVGVVELRLVSPQPSPPGANRRERLELAVGDDMAVLQLEVRVAGEHHWRALVSIDLREPLPIDDDRIAFHPATSAMGLIPAGVLQAMRRPVYHASQLGRALRMMGRAKRS